MKTFKLLGAVAIAIGLAACSDNSTPTVEGSEAPLSDAATTVGANIVETAQSADSFTTLVAALQATGLDTVLADPDREFTVFAPTDEAFAELGQDTINALLGDTETLTDILLYHVLADQTIDAATATSLAGQSAATANGQEVAISLSDGGLFINMSEVISADVFASNGVIHAIDTVLLPPPADTPVEDALPSIAQIAAGGDSFTLLTAALQATGLDAVLADDTATFTVFAPNDAAFNALGEETIAALLADPDTLSNILLYHVIAGQAVDSPTAISLAGQSVTTANGQDVSLSLNNGSLFINESEVIATDVQASNGIVHVIDAVLLPPSMMPEPEVTSPTPETSSETILEVARAAGFNTLVAAIEATGLDAAFGHPGDIYTVFAPTDAAFAALGQATIDALLADPDTLRGILLYHSLPGTVIDANTAVGLVGIDIEGGNGDILRLSQRDDGLYINDSRITATDIPAVNGIIHVIDAVLIPPSL